MALSRPLMSRLLSSRLGLRYSSSASSLLVNQGGKYQFLQDLGLKEQNLGVFDGEWKGSGEVNTFCTLEPSIELYLYFLAWMICYLTIYCDQILLYETAIKENWEKVLCLET